MSSGVFHCSETAWCPGCGNFDIVNTLTGVLDDLNA